jgi:hypothetical protein
MLTRSSRCAISKGVISLWPSQQRGPRLVALEDVGCKSGASADRARIEEWIDGWDRRFRRREERVRGLMSGPEPEAGFGCEEARRRSGASRARMYVGLGLLEVRGRKDRTCDSRAENVVNEGRV